MVPDRYFEGCSFINVLLQSPPASVVREAAAGHLAEIRTILARLASEAGLVEPTGLRARGIS